MKTIFLSILFSLLFYIVHAQQHSYDFLVNQYCQTIHKIDFEKYNKKELLQLNTDIGKELRTQHADTIEFIIRNIESTNDSITQMQALSIYSKHYLHDIIYHCNEYLKLNRALVQKCPPETKSLQYITLRINTYLSKHSEYTPQQILDSAGTKIFEYNNEIPEQVEKDYNFQFIHPKLVIDYLLHHSDAFMRAWLYRQSMKLFE
ncbi:MAG: hypothetical protein DSY76_01710 [Bacteroidetes bacterium]|nr:MAG: hypothetical protein DSY76_01710 [Bacteroidota bacterium]